MAFQTLAFLGFLALTVLLCHALGKVRPSLGRGGPALWEPTLWLAWMWTMKCWAATTAC